MVETALPITAEAHYLQLELPDVIGDALCADAEAIARLRQADRDPTTRLTIEVDDVREAVRKAIGALKTALPPQAVEKLDALEQRLTE